MKSSRIHTDEEGYVAFIPELKGCITTGTSITDALESLEDAKRTWLSSAIEDGNPIPEPARDEDASTESHETDKSALWKSLLGSVPGGDDVDVESARNESSDIRKGISGWLFESLVEAMGRSLLKGLVPRLVPRGRWTKNNSLHCRELFMELIGIEP